MTSRLPLVISLVVLLAGCNGATERMMENAIERQGGDNADVDVNADGSMRIETDQGTYTAGNNEVPADWPEDVTVYSDATVQYAASMNPTTGKPGSMIMITTSDSAQAVADFYAQDMVAQGWTVSGTMQNAGTTVIAGEKGDRVLSVSIAGSEGQTSVTIGVGEK